MNFNDVKSMRVPEGEVKKITDASGGVLWAAANEADTSDYTWLEYIHGIGTQCVDTGIKASIKISFQAGIVIWQTTGNTIIGNNLGNDDSDDLRLFNAQNKVYFDMKNKRISGGTWSLGTKYDIECGNFYVKQNGVQILSGETVTEEITGDKNIFVLGNSLGYTIEGQIYYLKIYDDGVLVRDYIPARRISDGAIGLYDKVSGALHTSVNGNNFIAGPMVGSDGETYYFCDNESAGEMFYTTGTQWIDTGMCFEDGDEFYFDYKTMAVDYGDGRGYSSGPEELAVIGGGRSTYGYIDVWAGGGDCGGFQPEIGAEDTLGVRFAEHWRMEGASINIELFNYTNGVTSTASRASSAFGPGYQSGSIMFFGDEEYGAAGSKKVFYSSWLKRSDGSYAFNMLPVLRESDYIAGIYDTINDIFYESAGDEPFYIGTPGDENDLK